MKAKVRQWDRDALASNSIIVETALRQLKLERADLRGQIDVMIPRDVTKFYDSCGVSQLTTNAKRLDFPRGRLVLGMQVHRAIGVFQVKGCFGQVIPAKGRSALAGCGLSTSRSRAYLHDVLGARTRYEGTVLMTM